MMLAFDVETVVPALAYEGGCSSVIDLRNLGRDEVAVDIEAHRADGALVSLEGIAGMTGHLAPGETIHVRAEAAWVKLREAGSARVAIQGTIECVEGGKLTSVRRDVAYPMRSPWLAGEVSELGDGAVLVINTSARAVTARVCYSSGAQFSVPGQEFQPVCFASSEVQVAPFGTRMFAVRKDGNRYFELRTSGAGIVMQMLRAIAGTTKVFSVDSAISFEGRQ
jgi:hypothetical protein